jgi:hypothetical protein
VKHRDHGRYTNRRLGPLVDPRRDGPPHRRNPTRSGGRLNVSQLAIEAGVKRWHLTHQHTDLKDLFQARVLEVESRRGSRTQAVDELQTLQKQHAELRKHCAVLEERVRTYAAVLNLLMLENAALSGRDTDSARVLPLPRREERGP